MDERPPHRAIELLQAAATISAIAIALAALMEEEGPAVGELYLLPLSFLATGLVALAGSLYAMEDVWRETGRPIKELLMRWDPDFNPPNPAGYVALRLITWGLLLLGLAYVFMLFVVGL